MHVVEVPIFFVKRRSVHVARRVTGALMMLHVDGAGEQAFGADSLHPRSRERGEFVSGATSGVVGHTGVAGRARAMPVFLAGWGIDP